WSRQSHVSTGSFGSAKEFRADFNELQGHASDQSPDKSLPVHDSVPPRAIDQNRPLSPKDATGSMIFPKPSGADKERDAVKSLIRLLKRKGANLDAATLAGMTSLMWAAEIG